MTNLTFAELTALMAVNGLVINDRYFVTDKNWTIIAISTSTYRIVVPIVTEVTKAELDALVAADELNQGLQYIVADLNWLLVATSNNTLLSIAPLVITNAVQKPNYIDSENIIWDSEIITADISATGGSPIEIIRPNGYLCDSIIFSSVCSGDSYLSNIGISTYMDTPLDELYTQKYPIKTINYDYNSGSEEISADGVGGIDNNTLRCVLCYKKAAL